MALVESTNIKIGNKMPEISLKDPSEKLFTSKSLRGPNGLLVVFTCNHCPYAKAIWPRLINLSRSAKSMGIYTVAINPNINPNYPEDSPENMTKFIRESRVPFPYLVDDTQQTARSYNAQCTPDIYLLDHNETLVYHGRFDDNWKESEKVTSQDLKLALENLALGKPALQHQFPSMGCSIKWNET